MSKIFVPEGRRVDITTTYADVDSARALTGSNIRGLFIFELTDSVSATLPRRWEYSFKGGFQYDGDDAKYFPVTGTGVNVTSVTAVSSGYSYDIVDVFGNTYRILFNGSKDYIPTIQRTAGAALTGTIKFRTILFSY